MHRESSLASASGPLPWLASLDAFAGPTDAGPLRDMARAFASAMQADGPGSEQTLRRFRWLAAVTGCDVVVGKLFEPHLDALSIIDELEGAASSTRLLPSLPADPIWAVWAAEGPGQLNALQDAEGAWHLRGIKSW